MNRRDQYEGRFRETKRGQVFGSEESDSYKAVASDDLTVSNSGELLQSLDKDLMSFRGCIDSIGSEFDSHESRQELRGLRAEIKRKIKTAEQSLREQKKKRSGPDKLPFDRLSKQLDTHVTTFEDLLQREKAAMHKHPNLPQSVGIDESDSERHKTAPGKQTQAQVQLSELEVREGEAEELGELERDIHDLHNIHAELADMVGDQGEVIDRIDDNVGVAQTRAAHGAKQIEKALVLTRRKRKLKLIIFIIIGSILLAIVIAVVILIAVLVTQLDDN